MAVTKLGRLKLEIEKVHINEIVPQKAVLKLEIEKVHINEIVPQKVVHNSKDMSAYLERFAIRTDVWRGGSGGQACVAGGARRPRQERL